MMNAPSRSTRPSNDPAYTGAPSDTTRGVRSQRIVATLPDNPERSVVGRTSLPEVPL